MKRLAVFGIAFVLVLAGEAQAAKDYKVRLTAESAREAVRGTGGYVHACERIAMRRFRCAVTYWKVEHTAEEVEPGRWEEVSATPVSEEATLVVGLFGIRRVQTPNT